MHRKPNFVFSFCVRVLIDCFEQFFASDRYNTSVFTVTNHRKRFTGPRLTVGEKRSVVPFEGIFKNAISKVIENVSLGSVFWRRSDQETIFIGETIMRPVGVIETEGFWIGIARRVCNCCGLAVHFDDAFRVSIVFSRVERPDADRYFDAEMEKKYRSEIVKSRRCDLGLQQTLSHSVLTPHKYSSIVLTLLPFLSGFIRSRP